MSEIRLETLNLNLLVALDALLALASVTKAAKKVGITQPAMSHALRNLRELFGDALLVRGPRSMTLTPLALRLYPRLRDCLADLQKILSEREGFTPATASDEFTIATADYMAAVLGPALARRLTTEAPKVGLRMRRLQVSALVDLVQNERVDLAIGPSLECPGSVHKQHLLDDPFVCALRRSKRVEGWKRLSIQRFAKIPQVLISPTGRGMSQTDTVLAASGLSRHVVLRCESFTAALAIAANSELMVTSPRSSVLRSVFHKSLVTFALPFQLQPLEICAYWSTRREAQPKLVWLRDLVVQECQGLAV